MTDPAPVHLTKPHLTKPQRHELGRLAREPQRTFGSGRARVQRGLVLKGCAEFTGDDGILEPNPEVATLCHITTLGLQLHQGSKK